MLISKHSNEIHNQSYKTESLTLKLDFLWKMSSTDYISYKAFVITNAFNTDV
jgi:hypothetical protein